MIAEAASEAVLSARTKIRDTADVALQKSRKASRAAGPIRSPVAFDGYGEWATLARFLAVFWHESGATDDPEVIRQAAASGLRAARQYGRELVNNWNKHAGYQTARWDGCFDAKAEWAERLILEALEK